jgi:hypothetical protein
MRLTTSDRKSLSAEAASAGDQTRWPLGRELRATCGKADMKRAIQSQYEVQGLGMPGWWVRCTAQSPHGPTLQLCWAAFAHSPGNVVISRSAWRVNDLRNRHPAFVCERRDIYSAAPQLQSLGIFQFLGFKIFRAELSSSSESVGSLFFTARDSINAPTKPLNKAIACCLASCSSPPICAAITSR